MNNRKNNRRPMPPEALRSWRRKMGALSQVRAAAMLGMSKVALVRAEREGAPLYIAYACAALAKQIGPWGIKKTDLQQFRDRRKIDGRHINLERKNSNGTASELQVA